MPLVSLHWIPVRRKKKAGKDINGATGKIQIWASASMIIAVHWMVHFLNSILVLWFCRRTSLL